MRLLNGSSARVLPTSDPILVTKTLGSGLTTSIDLILLCITNDCPGQRMNNLAV